jgi:hypothetical protein
MHGARVPVVQYIGGFNLKMKNAINAKANASLASLFA